MSLSRRQLLCTTAAAAIAPSLLAMAPTPVPIIPLGPLGPKWVLGIINRSGLTFRIGDTYYPVDQFEIDLAEAGIHTTVTGPFPMAVTGTVTVESAEVDYWRQEMFDVIQPEEVHK